MHDTGRRRIFVALLVVPWVVAAVLALAVARAWRESGRAIPLIDEPTEQRAWRGDRFVVVDDVVGWRPRSHVVKRMRIAPMGGSREHQERAHNNLGLIRDDDVTELPGGRRVLLLGDSHMMGVVDNRDNASHVLETLARERTGDPELSVYNAACGSYSLYQYVLRGRTLIERLRPDTLIAVLYVGNDLIELEDPGRPHIDDGGFEREPLGDALPEVITERLAALKLPRAHQSLFWQGLNQAAYFRDYPERIRPMLGRMQRSLTLLRELADAHDAPLLVAVIPSFDLVFPDRAGAVSEQAAALVRRNPNVNLHAALVAALHQQEIPTVDLLGRFRAEGRLELYAEDYHIHVLGHRLVAEALLERLLALKRG